MVVPKKKGELEVIDSELEDGLEFSATTAVLDLTVDIKKALAQETNPPDNLDFDIPPPKEIKNSPGKTSAPSKPATSVNKAPANSSATGSTSPSIPKAPSQRPPSPPPQTRPAPAASELEKVIEAQVIRTISKMGGIPGSRGGPTPSGNPEIDRRVQLEVFKAVENINREHAQRNRDLEMEIYSLLRKFANHPDFANEFDQIMKLLSDHSLIDKKFKKTG